MTRRRGGDLASRPRRRCQLHGKAIFASDVDAKNFLVTQSAAVGADQACRAYYDNDCRVWHLTSKPLEQADAAGLLGAKSAPARRRPSHRKGHYARRRSSP